MQTEECILGELHEARMARQPEAHGNDPAEKIWKTATAHS